MKSLLLILRNRHYFAVAWVFSSINILIGTWILYLPHIKAKFSLNDAEVGVALFFTACGLLFSIPFIPSINARLGTGYSTKLGILLLALAFNLPLLAPSYALLCGSLFLIGVLSGFTDVSMNALMSIIERRDDTHLMSAAHGFFSLGGFVGAGVGSVFLLYFSSPSVHMLGMTVVVILFNLWFARHYATVDEPAEKKAAAKEKKFWKTLRPVLGLSAIAFVVMFNEGAVEHWSNLFLYEVVALPQNQAGYGFVLFSLSMTIGRFLGDGFSLLLGSIKTLSYGCLVALLGYGLILTTHPYGSVLGFGALGLGLSVMVPEIYRLAGKNKQVSTSTAISTVSGVGFVGFLVGPVLLGLIANASALFYSYVFLLGSQLLAWGIVVFYLRRRY